jgi:hypothetical protein
VEKDPLYEVRTIPDHSGVFAIHYICIWVDSFVLLLSLLRGNKYDNLSTLIGLEPLVRIREGRFLELSLLFSLEFQDFWLEEPSKSSDSMLTQEILEIQSFLPYLRYQIATYGKDRKLSSSYAQKSVVTI